MSSEEQVIRIQETLKRVKAAVSSVVIGQDEVIDLALITLFSRGHALIEGVPGIAKTLLVRAVARAFGAPFNRIQFTPDLMPSDITGTSVYNLKTQTFELVQGPVFATFLLADEINRAPAKTQAALLQAMQERRVSIDSTTHRLSDNFIVFATQNPIEFEGTYPLPEAQKDRFLVKITMDYPAAEAESALLEMAAEGRSPEDGIERLIERPLLSESELSEVKSHLDAISITEQLRRYIVDIVVATRKAPTVLLGASPRASLALLHTSKALAALRDRDFVTPDDIKAMARAVLEHRIILKPEFEIDGLQVSEVVGEILKTCPVPR